MYKIVYNTGDGYYTSMAAARKANVVYRIGEWAQPPDWLNRLGFGLVCFETLNDVVRWITNKGKHEPGDHAYYKDIGVHQVFEVEIEEELLEHPMCRLYELAMGQIEEADASDWPDGTVWCRRVKLVKLVPYYEIYAKFEEMYQ